MNHILVLYGSHRRHGNSEALADRLVEGLDATRIYLAEKRILPYIDGRHDPNGFPALDDDYEEIIQQVRAHRKLVFATPLYWYSLSSRMKLFVDRWSQSLRDPRFDFKAEMGDKTAYLVVASADRTRLKSLPLVDQFRLTCEYFGMRFGGYVIGTGSRPGDVLQDGRALAEIEWLRKDLAAE